MNWTDIFDYCEESGKLTWRTRRANCVKVGSEAGFIHAREGYRFVCLERSQYAVHRIAWEMVNGEIPEGMEIDHIDGVRDNNSIKNLRLVSRNDNMKNKKVYKTSKSGVPGVTFRKDAQKWRVKVGDETIGHFCDLNDAISARHMAESVRGFHENHGRSK